MGIGQNDTGQRLLLTRRAFIAGAIIAAAMPTAWGEVPPERGSAPESPSEGVSLIARSFHTTTEAPFGTVLAGGSAHAPLSSVQIFDGQTWRNGPSMLRARYKHAAVACGGGVLVVGGLSSAGRPLSDGEFFDGFRWTAIRPMRLARSEHALVVYNGLVLAVGGISSLPISSVEAFDGLTWRDFASLNVPRYGHTAADAGGAVVVTGGRRFEPLSTIETFDGVKWRRGASR